MDAGTTKITTYKQTPLHWRVMLNHRPIDRRRRRMQRPSFATPCGAALVSLYCIDRVHRMAR
jgi:hypothetical protein